MRKFKKIFAICLVMFGVSLMFSVSSIAKSYDWKIMKGTNDVFERNEKYKKRFDPTYRRLYIVDCSLYETIYYNEKDGKHIKPTNSEITFWKMDESYQNLSLVTVKGNTAYVQLSDEAGKSRLYSVNIKTGKKRLVSNKFYASPTTTNYAYAETECKTDTGAYSTYVWKFTDSSAKRVRKLGKYIFVTKVVGKYVYYGKYKGSSQKNVNVYRANLDGTHQKKLFTVKGKGKYVQSYISSIKKNKITVLSYADNKSVQYIYNIKTKKLKKK